MKLRKVVSVGLSVCCLTALACSDNPPQKKKISGKVKMPATEAPLLGDVAKITAQTLFLEILVNERPAVRQTADLPILLTIAFANPHQAMALPLPGLGWLKPIIRPQGGKRDQSDGKPLLEWTRPGLKTTSLEPGQSLRLTWILQGALPEGKYRLGLEGLDSLVDKKEAAIRALRLSPAILEIIPGRGDPQVAAYWERKSDALTKGPKAWLGSLDKALAEDPGNRSLRYEKVRALAALDRPDQARQELAGLMQEARKKLSAKNAQSKAHLPYFYYQALADLHRRTGQKQKTP